MSKFTNMIRAILLIVIVLLIINIIFNKNPIVNETDSKDEVKETKFIAYPGVDSNGGDIRNVGKKTLTELKQACIADPNCVAFNSAGWLKRKLTIPAKWSISPETLYIKEHKAPISPDRLYVKITGHDSNGGDIGNYKMKYHGLTKQASIANYGLQCSQGKMNKKCKGFNSEGWFKNTIKNASKFAKTVNDLYIKIRHAPSDILKMSPIKLVVL